MLNQKNCACKKMEHIGDTLNEINSIDLNKNYQRQNFTSDSNGPSFYKRVQSVKVLILLAESPFYIMYACKLSQTISQKACRWRL